MKKTSGVIFRILLLFCAFGLQSPCRAYESVILDFPAEQGWHKVFYDINSSGALAQYAPRYQTRENNIETVVYRSFKFGSRKKVRALDILNSRIQDIREKQPTVVITPVKSSGDDSIIYWCAPKNANFEAQCEIIRSTKSFEGVILMHYISKDLDLFERIKNTWIKRIKEAKIYYSYYRTDYILNKDAYFEL